MWWIPRQQSLCSHGRSLHQGKETQFYAGGVHPHVFFTWVSCCCLGSSRRTQEVWHDRERHVEVGCCSQVQSSWLQQSGVAWQGLLHTETCQGCWFCQVSQDQTSLSANRHQQDLRRRHRHCVRLGHNWVWWINFKLSPGGFCSRDDQWTMLVRFLSIILILLLI